MATWASIQRIGAFWYNTDDMTETHTRPVTVALPTLGCKVNRYDSDTLARALRARGYVIVPPHQPAEVYIVNTCTVTREADAKSRKALRQAIRRSPDATVIVTGCYATAAADALAAWPGVTAVVPITEQHTIPEAVARLRPPVVVAEPPRGLTASAQRTRATVKAQDGCNLRCAYCAVAPARGPLRSRPLTEVLREMQTLIEDGYQEIVLTGVRLDAYGLEHGTVTLADLIDATHSLYIPRLHLSSLEPIGIDARLIDACAAHPTLCHHFHLCLQSGDDAVLAAMRRGYTADDYRRLIARLRDAIPDATFTTDVIVGFPGESDASFARTCVLIAEIGFIDLHIFPYSPRPGTAAAEMPDQIADAVKDARSRHLHALARELFARHAASRIGHTVTVLVEKSGKDGNGLTAHYERVYAPFAANLTGNIVSVRVADFVDMALRGVPITQDNIA